jgi:hypothetical protein
MFESTRARVPSACEIQFNAHGPVAVNFTVVHRKWKEGRNPMKTKLFAVAVALLLSAVATSTCYAQQSELAVKIPFAFQAGNHTMPAGEYLVKSVTDGGGTVQRLRQVDGNVVMNVFTLSVETRNGDPSPRLVFHRYGETYFLAQIWTGLQGRQLFRSNREKEIAREEGRTEIALALQPTAVRP